MPLALIELDFDPQFHLAGRSLPLETIALAGVVLLMLAVAAFIAGRTSEAAVVEQVPAAGADAAAHPVAPSDESDPPRHHLRRDDVLLIGLGALPGAVAGGRLVYGLVHLDYYTKNPNALLDPSTGSLSLTGAVIGGLLTGTAVAHLLGPSLERWLRVAFAPLLLGLALGKAAFALGGEGQGVASSGPLALRFGGAGPWPDAAARIASQPSQLFEAAAVALVLLLVGLIALLRPARSGVTLFGLALGLWGLARFAVAFSWRDSTVLGPLRAEQLACLGVALFGLAVLAVSMVRRRRVTGNGKPDLT